MEELIIEIGLVCPTKRLSGIKNSEMFMNILFGRSIKKKRKLQKTKTYIWSQSLLQVKHG